MHAYTFSKCYHDDRYNHGGLPNAPSTLPELRIDKPSFGRHARNVASHELEDASQRDMKPERGCTMQSRSAATTASPLLMRYPLTLLYYIKNLDKSKRSPSAQKHTCARPIASTLERQAVSIVLRDELHHASAVFRLGATTQSITTNPSPSQSNPSPIQAHHCPTLPISTPRQPNTTHPHPAQPSTHHTHKHTQTHTQTHAHTRARTHTHTHTHI
jgi:hypothetical protein